MASARTLVLKGVRRPGAKGDRRERLQKVLEAGERLSWRV